MTDNAELAALIEELATLRARVDELSARPAPPPDDQAVSRRHLLRGLAGLGAAGAATAAGIATAEPAAAADGDPLILGQSNTVASTTTLTGTGDHGSAGLLRLVPLSGPALRTDAPNDVAIESSGFMALRGAGTYAGVVGEVVDTGIGVIALASEAGGSALAAVGVQGPSIWAESDDGVPLLLVPTAQPGPPVVGSIAGSFSIDAQRDLWLCVADGTPGTWTRLLREDTAAGRVVPITPLRVLDTRTATGQAAGGPVVPGQIKGPLKGGQTVTLSLAGITPIPATATGIVGNAIILTPNGTGYLRLLAGDTTTPTGTVEFTTATRSSSAFTSALAPTGLSAIAPISPTITYHLVLDITAYIT